MAKLLANNWHEQFPEHLERWLRNQPKFMDRYDIWNSNSRRFIFLGSPNITRKEILSNPDMILANKKNDNFDFMHANSYTGNVAESLFSFSYSKKLLWSLNFYLFYFLKMFLTRDQCCLFFECCSGDYCVC